MGIDLYYALSRDLENCEISRVASMLFGVSVTIEDIQHYLDMNGIRDDEDYEWIFADSGRVFLMDTFPDRSTMSLGRHWWVEAAMNGVWSYTGSMSRADSKKFAKETRIRGAIASTPAWLVNIIEQVCWG